MTSDKFPQFFERRQVGAQPACEALAGKSVERRGSPLAGIARRRLCNGVADRGRHGSGAKAEFVGMIASCEFNQPALQPLIYDLEAGIPFLLADQVAVRTPTTSPGEGKLRILLAVSGQRQVAR
jgi:hypothetical protein